MNVPETCRVLMIRALYQTGRGEQKLLMMRPYQTLAAKANVKCIHQNCANGHIWHTTGTARLFDGETKLNLVA